MVINNLLDTNYKSGLAHATEGLSVAIPKNQTTGGNLTSNMFLDLAGSHRPMTSDLLNKQRELILKSAKGREKFKLILIVESQKEELLNQELDLRNKQRQSHERPITRDHLMKEYEELNRLLSYETKVSATVEKVAIEEFLKNAAFLCADVFLMIVNEMTWGEQQLIDSLINSVQEHNRNTVDDATAKKFGIKSNVIHLLHNFKLTEDNATLKELKRQFIKDTFVTGSFSNTLLENNANKPQGQEEIPDTTDEFDFEKMAFDSVVETVTPVVETTSEDEFLDVYTSHTYGRDVVVKHYYLGRNNSANENDKNHASYKNAYFIKELGRNLSNTTRALDSPGLLERLLYAIVSQAKAMFKQVKSIDLYFEKNGDLVFKHDGELELIHGETEMHNHSYQIKDSKPVVKMDIVYNEFFMHLIIDAPGMKFVLPKNPGAKVSGLGKSEKSTIEDIRQETNLKENEFSAVITSDHEIIIFGVRGLLLRKQEPIEINGEEKWYRNNSQPFVYANEDAEGNKVIAFAKSDEIIQNGNQPELLRSNRGFGTFVYRYTQVPELRQYRYEDNIIADTYKDGTTQITFAHKIALSATCMIEDASYEEKIKSQ